MQKDIKSKKKAENSDLENTRGENWGGFKTAIKISYNIINKAFESS
jgi:hypothetical protein